ncbi:sensor histidine kinase [Glycomyces artemisiae]|uniref:sensor histidine kinase n=1 Tax=Glycomyces artemisiae TaxID=1076443 RepID=UPI000D061945|nr:HAMP domain-containing sensor histidine kinase [Glycomyces artemisiae]
MVKTRTRFTVLYGAAFLICGAGLLALVFALSGGDLADTQPAPGQGTASPEDQVAALQRQLAELDDLHSRQILTACLSAFALMVVVSLLVGRVLAKRVLRPLRRITAVTRGITAEHLDRRLALPGPRDEVTDLADTVDDLLGRLEASFAAQRRFAADASHELRTPLATMRATVDVAAAKPAAPASVTALAERLRPQLDQVDRLLDGLLALARAQHGAVAADDTVDLAAVAAAAIEARADDIATARLTVTTAAEPGSRVRGDTALLARMVGNLIDNAVDHNGPDGAIAVATAPADGKVRLTVRSSGPVLDQAAVDDLVRPFHRLGADRTGSDRGSGLGLAIVHAVAAAHGGALTLTAAPEGGLTATVDLPEAPR